MRYVQRYARSVQRAEHISAQDGWKIDAHTLLGVVRMYLSHRGIDQIETGLNASLQTTMRKAP